MIFSVLKTTFRSLRRHLGFVGVSVAGLALGLAATTLLLLFVEHEWSYDRFHDDVDALYRIVENETSPDGERVIDVTRMPFLPVVAETVPDVAAGTRVDVFSEWMEGTGSAVRTRVAFVDPAFFDVFSFDVLRGPARKALQRPGAIALTASTAKRLFGDADPLGKTIRAAFGKRQYVVTALVADPPSTSTIQFDALAARENRSGLLSRLGSWYNTNSEAYVRLLPDASEADVETKLAAIGQERFDVSEGKTRTAALRPVTEMHAAETNSTVLVQLLGALALAILTVAAINVTNLTTVRGLDRIAEVGVRRALGARPRTLAVQFASESVLTSLIALGVAVVAVSSALPTFNRMLDLNLALQWHHLPLLVGVSAVVGIVVGAYPAVRLARTRPGNELRGNGTTASGSRLRTGLVVVQIAVSTLLILGAVAGWAQIDHLRGQHTGVPGDRIAVAPISYAPFDSIKQANARLRSLRADVLRHPDVDQATFTRSVPARYERNFNSYSLPGAGGVTIRFRFAAVSHDYFDTFGMKLLDGRPFQTSQAEDGAGRDVGVIVNETAAAQIEAITGAPAVGTGLQAGGADVPVSVRGVVEDVRIRTAGKSIEPVLHYYFGDFPARYDYLAVQLAPGRTQEALSGIQETWTGVYSTYPFDAFFVDDAFDQLYETHRQVGLLSAVAAGVAILIACIGLFSLAAFTVLQRTKEIGVRKVLGATAASIVALLSKDVLKLVGAGLVIAIPVGYVGLAWGLREFATRVDLGPALFAAASAGVLGLAALAVSAQAVRAALLDPARTLRDE